MSDHNQSKDNDKFRHLWSNENERDSESGETPKARDEEPATSYYRYGPFQSVEEVEVTAPEPVKPVPALQPEATWQPPQAMKKRSSWKSMFAAFMAGVVVVGGLMFASDKADLFTADEGALSGGSANRESAPVVKQVQGESGDNGDIQNAALDVVRPNNISEIVANSRAAVVKIETFSKASTQRSRSQFFDDDFFRYFFGNGAEENQPSQSGQLVKTGEGSGFIFDSAGYILTNQHVVDGADEVRVYVEGFDHYFKAEKLGESYDLDLAAVKITGKTAFPSLKLGSADSLNVGDWVVAIGNPYGFDHTVTVGVLSAKERPITIPDGNRTREYEHLLQTDASINPGNSGGPLLNLSGEVIGINTAVNAQAQGIGFAIPTSTISDVLDNLKNDKPIPKEPAPYVGVYLGELDETTASQLGYKGTAGALVTQVEVGGPANKAGIQAGDIITEVDGTKIKTYEDVSKAIQKHKVGSRATLKVFREGKYYEVATVVGDRNATEQ